MLDPAKYKPLGIVLLLSILLFSCNDDEYKSPGEIAAAQFSKMVKEKYVNAVTVQEWGANSYYIVAMDVEFTIDGAFLVIGDNRYYNFEKLQFFTYDGGKHASVYFK